jgi:hypothetical protein
MTRTTNAMLLLLSTLAAAAAAADETADDEAPAARNNTATRPADDVLRPTATAKTPATPEAPRLASAPPTPDLATESAATQPAAAAAPPTDAWSSLGGAAAQGAATPRTAGPLTVSLTGTVEPTAPDGPEHSGEWLLTTSVGLHDCTGDYCGSGRLDTSPFLGQSVELYLRLNDYVALGVGFAALEMLPDEDEVTANFFAGLAGVQGFLPLTERLDLWGGVAAGYGGTLIDIAPRDGGSGFRHAATFHGPVVAFAGGLDFVTWSWLTLGPSFTYYLTLWDELCVTGYGLDESCVDWDERDADARDAETLDYWMVAFRTTMTF